MLIAAIAVVVVFTAIMYIYAGMVLHDALHGKPARKLRKDR